MSFPIFPESQWWLAPHAVHRQGVDYIVGITCEDIRRRLPVLRRGDSLGASCTGRIAQEDQAVCLFLETFPGLIGPNASLSLELMHHRKRFPDSLLKYLRSFLTSLTSICCSV